MRQAGWRLRLVVFVTLLAGATQFGLPLLRPAAAFAFLLVCPGAALMGFIRLRSVVADVVLSVALSFALAALVAGTTVLLGSWPLEAAFWFLLGMTLLCSAAQLHARADRTPGT